MSTETRRRRGGLPPPQETIEKLEAAVNDGKFYETQQMYKTFSARYAAAHKYSEALEILQSGASLQLKYGQVTCGAELAVLFVGILVNGKILCNEEILDRVEKIFGNFPHISLPQQLVVDEDAIQKISQSVIEAKLRVEGCSSFLKAAIKWSAEFGEHKNGSPELYSLLAEYIYSESPELDMAKISVYFIKGKNPGKLAFTLVSFMDKCYPGEDDLAIARAVLLYLSQEGLKNANYLMNELRKNLESKKLGFPQSELIQFIVYLLQTLAKDNSLPLFRLLRKKYEPSIDREALFEELLDAIEEKFYGVQHRSGLEMIFGDILNIMGGEN
ncbi:Golgi to ER traffic protein 4 [Zostera marina]|uniref:Golgi to ER traffic protein 4 n=1 Tax=Zostera marina TaxID=29655 RepID=A0A0K9PM64_ZOSMR|nr:Golgi to ER traffic protein 4 [Zostera marina]